MKISRPSSINSVAVSSRLVHLTKKKWNASFLLFIQAHLFNELVRNRVDMEKRSETQPEYLNVSNFHDNFSDF